jgi:hypothetical protein
MLEPLPPGPPPPTEPVSLPLSPAEAVVAEGDREEGVVLAAADVGAHGCRNEFDDGDPPPGAQQHRADADDRADDAASKGGVGEEHVAQAEEGHDEQHLEGLGEEAEPDEDADDGHPLR